MLVSFNGHKYQARLARQGGIAGPHYRLSPVGDSPNLGRGCLLSWRAFTVLGEYQIIRHPKSGEQFAVKLDENDEVCECAGPLYYADIPATRAAQAEFARDYLRNQDFGDIIDDAAWMRAELERHP